ncbi:hypothetical protein RR46_08710 [Papilio xuthus]|uniref:Uncharacterized protein n=1 Tax=Papilio xuthus TaxID=66420 RepID=A0A194Q825_PAPXU|nr:hypothetical protein RR46_08710 [Papilio xuthus]
MRVICNSQRADDVRPPPFRSLAPALTVRTRAACDVRRAMCGELHGLRME